MHNFFIPYTLCLGAILKDTSSNIPLCVTSFLSSPNYTRAPSYYGNNFDRNLRNMFLSLEMHHGENGMCTLSLWQHVIMMSPLSVIMSKNSKVEKQTDKRNRKSFKNGEKRANKRQIFSCIDNKQWYHCRERQSRLYFWINMCIVYFSDLSWSFPIVVSFHCIIGSIILFLSSYTPEWSHDQTLDELAWLPFQKDAKSNKKIGRIVDAEDTNFSIQ